MELDKDIQKTELADDELDQVAGGIEFRINEIDPETLEKLKEELEKYSEPLQAPHLAPVQHP